MSSYATRLAARGMGRAAGALLAPRAVPRAVPGTPLPTIDAAAAPARPTLVAQVAEQSPGRTPVAELATAEAPSPTSRATDPAGTPRAGALARATPTQTEGAGRAVERKHTTELRGEAERTRERTPASSAGARRAKPAALTGERLPATAPTERRHEIRVSTERIQTVAEPKAAALATPPVPGPPMAPPHSPAAPGAQGPIVRPASAEVVAASPVELKPRSLAPAPVPASPAARAAAQAEAPTVEVRIGKVEVRAPRSPNLRGWSSSGTAPAAPSVPAEPPFARMAAARRYLDRSWG